MPRKATFPKKRLLSKDFIQKVSNICGYHQYEVADVLQALQVALYDDICQGMSLEFDKLFLLEVKDTKNKPMNREGVWITSPVRKTVRFHLNRSFENELRRIAREDAKRKESPSKKPNINPNPSVE